MVLSLFIYLSLPSPFLFLHTPPTLSLFLFPTLFPSVPSLSLLFLFPSLHTPPALSPLRVCLYTPAFPTTISLHYTLSRFPFFLKQPPTTPFPLQGDLPSHTFYPQSCYLSYRLPVGKPLRESLAGKSHEEVFKLKLREEKISGASPETSQRRSSQIISGQWDAREETSSGRASRNTLQKHHRVRESGGKPIKVAARGLSV